MEPRVLVHVTQVLYHEIYPQAFTYFILFWDSIMLRCLSWPWTQNPPASASWVAVITDLYHHTWHQTPSWLCHLSGKKMKNSVYFCTAKHFWNIWNVCPNNGIICVLTPILWYT
jgi:hypothetical protein